MDDSSFHDDCSLNAADSGQVAQSLFFNKEQ
jgi:hypothetical protein